MARSLAGRFAVGGSIDAEELAHDVLTDLLTSARSGGLRLGSAANVDQYLAAVMRNRIVDRVRASSRGRTFQSLQSTEALDIIDESRPSSETEIVGAVERKERLAEVERLIAELPPHERSVIELRTTKDLSISEIAASLGLSHRTVRVLLSRALLRLRAGLRKRFPDET